MAGSGVPRVWRTDGEIVFSKEFALGVDDHLQTKFARTAPVRRAHYVCAVGVVGVFAGLIYSYGWYRDGETMRFLLAVAAFLAGGLLAGWLSYGFAGGFVSGFWRGFLNERELIGIPIRAEASSQGLRYEARGQVWSAPWDSLHAIEEDDRLFYFWISRYYAQVWPKRVLSEEEIASFRDRIGEWAGSPPVSPPRLAGNVTPQY
jgi:hypothetical protein